MIYSESRVPDVSHDVLSLRVALGWAADSNDSLKLVQQEGPDPDLAYNSIGVASPLLQT